MEQYNQKIDQKSPLPIKTKIAAWWILVHSGILSINFLSSFHLFVAGFFHFFMLFYLAFFILYVLLFIFSIHLLKARKKAWFVVTIVNSGLTILWGFMIFIIYAYPWSYMAPMALFFLFPLFIFSLIPLALLFLDRKNFWKIAS